MCCPCSAAARRRGQHPSLPCIARESSPPCAAQCPSGAQSIRGPGSARLSATLSHAHTHLVPLRNVEKDAWSRLTQHGHGSMARLARSAAVCTSLLQSPVDGSEEFIYRPCREFPVISLRHVMRQRRGMRGAEMRGLVRVDGRREMAGWRAREKVRRAANGEGGWRGVGRGGQGTGCGGRGDGPLQDPRLCIPYPEIPKAVVQKADNFGDGI